MSALPYGLVAARLASPPRPPVRPYVAAAAVAIAGVVLELQVRVAGIVRELPWKALAALALESASLRLVTFAAAMAAVYAIDCLVPSRAARLSLRPIVIAAVAWGAGEVIHGLLQVQPAAIRYGLASSPGALILHNTWQAVAFVLLASFYVDYSQQRQRAEERVRRVQDALMNEQRAVLQSRLAALRARVDTRLLFATLARIEQLYARSPTDAESGLDRLSDYLRGAIPQLHSPESTLGRELDFAQAYASLVSFAQASAAGLDVDLPPALRTAPFPAGVLLPLLRRALAGGSARPRLSVQPSRTGIGLRFETASPFDLADITGVRTTLAEVFGDRAQVTTAAQPQAHVLDIEVPCRG